MFDFANNKEKFSQNITKILKDKNITRQDLADKTGVSKSSIDNICNPNNKTIPNIEVIYNIAKVLGVSVEFLLTGEAENPNTKDVAFDFYPNRCDITPFGIFSAINYLLVAFGEKIIQGCGGYKDNPEYMTLEFGSFNGTQAIHDYLFQIDRIKTTKSDLTQIKTSILFHGKKISTNAYVNLLYNQIFGYVYNENHQVLDDDLPF